MDPVFAFELRLPAPGSRQLLRTLHAQLRAAILEGRLQPGQRLPSSRAVARSLGISRNTAVAVYDLLLSEGYLRARRASGIQVVEGLPAARAPALSAALGRRHLTARARAAVPAESASSGLFRLGVPELQHLPFDIWRRLGARCLRQFAREPVHYAGADGCPALREAIAHHVAFARAVACRAEDIVVTSGAQQAFDLLARVLVTPGKTRVAVEEPGYPPLRAAFAAAGAELVPVRVDAEGLQVERLPKGVRLVCVTPSHQFPLGCAMSPQRRKDLLAWARQQDALIVEDDYDGEFRYGERPLEALQTLDGGERVFYVGTFSKSLFPALRLGYVASPAWARAALVAARHDCDSHANVLAQDTLAAFIAEGHLARHVRRMQPVYAQRRNALLQGLQREFGGLLQVLPAQAGLHLSAQLEKGTVPPAWLARTAPNAAGVATLHRFQLARAGRAGLVFGFGVADVARIGPALAQLRRLWQLG
ncbi:GntR family transcriptional regulator [Tahibacter aquaticus]|uniref:GntR family transcriptional regulator n=1 Tax=Tahibacter aquaticus TaxID=520092 RepID=A0A4R6Z9Y9_9GAMM|nr:PLP-dependent aminotransferase family protein [Tahibacter aquaticus]TDR48741.1 GntR family transcriptional regulator [Tahibacter aquaticus]